MLENKHIDTSIENKAKELLNSEILFAVVGDLTNEGRYGESAVFFTENKMCAYDKTFDGLYKVYDYSDIEEAKVKRLYGNAMFRVKLKTGRYENVIRFSYAAADVADAAANFIEDVNSYGYDEEYFLAVKSTYDKMRSFCPKCGRKLAHPGAPCINCEGKKKMFSKLMVYVKPEMKGLIVCLVLSALTTLMSLVPPYITQRLVDDIIPGKDKSGLLHVIIFLLGLYVVQHVITGVRAFMLRTTGDKIIANLKKDIFAKAQYLPMRFYDKTSTGSVINRINSDTTNLQNFVMKISQEAIVQFFTMIGIIGIMMYMNWKMALLSLIPVPIVAIIARYFGKLIKPKYMRLWRRNSAISTMLADNIPGVRVIKAFSNEKRVINKFSNYIDEWYREDRAAGVYASIFPTAITFLVTCGSVIIWYFGGSRAIDGNSDITAGLLVSFITYATMFYNPVNFFANLSDTYQNTLTSAEKILDIIDAEPEHDFGKFKNNDDALMGKIEFKNVNFSFDRSKKTLTNINLSIEPGDIVGIVGTTGSGKSTLINLLMRYYDDYEGEILVDGKNIKDIDLEYYRSQIGFVQQEPLMFKDTVFNNIAYGCSNAHVEEVLHAAQVANAHGFISKMPDAYDTMLGERGIGLSGGEKQRVSIARAVLKNPGILIFDEATAAVDSETEHQIQGAIERLITGRTTLMIAHRLSTLRKANKIVVVDKGEIIECGPPEELIAKKGKYYKLVQIQSMSEQLLMQKADENFE